MTATYTKPITIPRWCSTGTNILEPPNAKKNEGWLFEEIPPSAYDNWLGKSVGDWVQWINERFFDGSTKDELLLKSPGSVVNAVRISDTGVKSELPVTIQDANFKLLYTTGLPQITFDTDAWLEYVRSLHAAVLQIGGVNVLTATSSGSLLAYADICAGSGYVRFGAPADANQIRFNTSGSKFTLEISGVPQYTFDTIKADLGNRALYTTGNIGYNSSNYTALVANGFRTYVGGVESLRCGATGTAIPGGLVVGNLTTQPQSGEIILPNTAASSPGNNVLGITGETRFYNGQYYFAIWYNGTKYWSLMHLIA